MSTWPSGPDGRTWAIGARSVIAPSRKIQPRPSRKRPNGVDESERDFLRAPPVAPSMAPSVAPPGAPSVAPSVEPCRFFLQGICRNGARCRFSHDATVEGTNAVNKASHLHSKRRRIDEANLQQFPNAEELVAEASEVRGDMPGRPVQTTFQGKQLLLEVIDCSSSDHAAAMNNLAQRYSRAASSCPHLVSWYGWAEDDMFKYFAFGDIQDFAVVRSLLTPGTDTLHWRTRLTIMVEVALAMRALHSYDPPLIHGNLQTRYLLYNSETQQTRLAGSGIGLLKASAYEEGEAADEYDSDAFCDPTYARNPSKVTPKGEVYAFGFILLEILTGLEPEQVLTSFPKLRSRDESVKHCLGRLGPFVDISADWPGIVIGRLGDIALRCILEREEDRPSFADLAGRLRRCLDADYPVFVPEPTEEEEGSALAREDSFVLWWSPCDDPKFRTPHCQTGGKPCTRKGCDGFHAKTKAPCAFCHHHPADVVQRYEAKRGFARKLRKCADKSGSPFVQP